MAQVTIEFVGWLAEQIGPGRDSPVILRETVGEGQTLAGLLATLVARYPSLADIVFDPSDQRVHDQVAVILNGRVYQAVGGLGAALHDGDRLVLLPGFAGG
ncbi:MAG: MoaD/ThiS family protein [Chloroflexota bacterium]